MYNQMIYQRIFIPTQLIFNVNIYIFLIIFCIHFYIQYANEVSLQVYRMCEHFCKAVCRLANKVNKLYT